MDSMAENANARSAKRARVLAPPAGGVDLISGLDDDVLLRVLGMVADVRDAARATAVSRRWLRLWARVPALRFASRPVSRAASGAERCAALEQFVSFVSGILARRRTPSDCSVESLAISCGRGLMPLLGGGDDPETDDLERRLRLASVRAAQEWIRHAFQHGTKSLALDMHLPVRLRLVGERRRGNGEKAILLDGLPSPARLETLRLQLDGARLGLSATMKFTSLSHLSLERIRIADGSGAALFARLVSSTNCPHLQKLSMNKLWFRNLGEVMRLEADKLLELWVEDVNIIMSLELRTPSLRVLHIEKSYHEVLSISAPRLEKVELLFTQGCLPRVLEVHGGLPCVRRLKLCICLWSCSDSVSAIHPSEPHSYTVLFKSCSVLTRLEVNLAGPKTKEHVHLIKDRMPHLPQITSLKVNVSKAFDRHNFGAGVASLLTRFTNLRHLSLHLPSFITLYDYDPDEELEPECDHPDYWTSPEISMADLEEVEFTGLTGTECELWFIEDVLESAERLRKVVISLNPKCWENDAIDELERMFLDEGMQTCFLS